VTTLVGREPNRRLPVRVNAPDRPSAIRALRRVALIAAVASVAAVIAAVPADAARRGRTVTIAAAGDISPEGTGHDAETAAIIRRIHPTAVLTLGDHQYPDGTLDDFRTYYDTTWGRFIRRTDPAPGNHDCHIEGCADYFTYFGDRARDGSYAFVLGRWRLISLNSSGDIEAQANFLRRVLLADDHRCELVYWHHPRWSSGPHGSNEGMSSWWDVAYAQGVDVILNGHDHLYERFTKLSPEGRFARDGIREFVVGTGGAELYDFRPDPVRGSQERIEKWGVLEMQLEPDGYEWAFRSTDDGRLDHGSSRCHD
jgi:calcineurin-like phosphoesterase family protein